MPCLIPEILFEIAKNLVEDGDSEAIIQFALSGKESFKAMRNAFSSVRILKLYKNGYAFGWKKHCPYFGVESIPEFLWNQIGNSVKELRVDCSTTYIQEMYQPFIDTIVDKQQLITFSAGKRCNKAFLDEFFPQVSSTLKNVTTLRYKMTRNFRNSWNLQSLTIINPDGFDIAYYCCMTTSLTLSYRDSNSYALPKYEDLNHRAMSPYLNCVKELIVTDKFFRFHIEQFQNIIKYFPSLESIKYDIRINPTRFPEGIWPHVNNFTNIINLSSNVPSKITCSLSKAQKHMEFFDVEVNKELFDDFQFDNSNPDFTSFQKIISTADSQSTLLEIQFCNY